MFHVYVLRNDEGPLYIGHTDDLSRRLAEHAAGLSRWTRSRGPGRMILSEPYATRSQAMKRERALKSGQLNQELRARAEADGSTVERVLPGKD